jgi:hypothetical protein
MTLTALECSSVLASGIMGTPWEVVAELKTWSWAGGNVMLYPENVVNLPALYGKEFWQNVSEIGVFSNSGLRMRIATAPSLPHALRAFSYRASNRRPIGIISYRCQCSYFEPLCGKVF